MRVYFVPVNKQTSGASRRLAVRALTVLDGVLDGAQPIPDSIFDLCEGVLVGPLHQQGHRARVTTLLHKRVLLLSLRRDGPSGLEAD
jgi:hypothetical protein